MTEDRSWFTVRSVVAWPADQAGGGRRPTRSGPRCGERGTEPKAAEHAELVGGQPMGLSQAFTLAIDAAPADGAEIFSLICDSALPSVAYLEAFFDSGTERQRSIGEPP